MVGGISSFTVSVIITVSLISHRISAVLMCLPDIHEPQSERSYVPGERTSAAPLR